MIITRQRFCNVNDEHQFQIKQELIVKSGLFIVKKRYGMKIINDNGVKVNKTMVKGLDTIRSNFPNANEKFNERSVGRYFNECSKR